MEQVAVIGLGAIGAAISWRLTASGQPVVGFDRYRPGHSMGSSHGATRIIRQAYYEHPDYVPLVRRSWHRWQELGRAFGRSLLVPTGGLMLGPVDSVVMTGTLASIERHGLRHELLEAGDLRRRFPQFRLPADEVGVFEQQAGALRCELGVDTMVRAAVGAVHPLTVVHEQVLRLEPISHGIGVYTASGRRDFQQVVVAAGGWAGELLADWQLPLQVERQVQVWFSPSDARSFHPPELPIWMRQQPDGEMFYGIPAVDGDLVKVARHHSHDATTMTTLDRRVSDADLAPVVDFISDTLPTLGTAVTESSVCAYTNTPDCHFLIGRLKAAPPLVVAVGFSGHGFKFAPVIGDLVTDIVQHDAAPPALFAPGRFGL